VSEIHFSNSVFHPRPPVSWAPLSACTQGCLPAPAGSRVRQVRRLMVMVPVLVGTMLGVAVLPGRLRERWLRGSARALLRASGVRLRVRGEQRFADGGALVVANHLSWVEVVALNAVQPVRMLAKREVRDWPLIGPLAARTGALFVDRFGLSSLPATVADTAAALRDGAVIGVFPEGTTHCGKVAGPFRRAAFQAAIDAGVPVRPVAFRLLEADGTAAAGAPFVGDQTLADSVGRVLRASGLVCEVTVLPPIHPAGDRRELAGRAGAAVAAVTGVAHAPWRTPVPAGAAVAA
jgi:1-acyl-sn-glycerol-3-phosphate acyltransferase